jgi:tetratricopeptide (TPR) repeat protein
MNKNATTRLDNKSELNNLIENASNLVKNGKPFDGIAVLKSGLESLPERASLCNEIGVIYYHEGDIESARDWFSRSIDEQPDLVRGITNLGACFNDLGENARAIECYQQALELAPNMKDAWGNLAKAYTDSDEFELAVYCYRKALRLGETPDLLRGLAKAYRKAGRNNRAEALLREVIKSNPEDQDAWFGLSFSLFQQKKYPEALMAHEWRLKTREMIQHRKDLYPIFERPGYAGEDLGNKTLLLHSEQGFGDSLQFCRFIRLLEPVAKKLVLWTRPGLGRLISDNFNIAEYSENIFALPDFDAHLSIMSIPHWFDPELSSLKDKRPYLTSLKNCGLNTSPEPRLKVGLVWGASDSGFDYANKRIPLSQLSPVFTIPGISWHSLQVGSDCAELQNFERREELIDIGQSLKDFSDTAAAVAEMDLVISCDTSVAHLAGAMGKPLWVVLKKEPDWRWGSDGETSPWYASARLYRQQSHGDWTIVVKRLVRDLRQMIATSRNCERRDASSNDR